VAADRTYTVDQIARAAIELRQAAGTDEQRFSGEQAIGMLSEEIRLLRERGFTDDQIANLLSGFDIEVTAQDLAKTVGEPDLS